MSDELKQTPTVQYLGNGVAKEFAYLRTNWDENDIYVFLGDELQTKGYTIIAEDLSEGVIVAFEQAPEDGVLITITRILKLERTTHFEESGAFKAKVINEELDRLVAMIQQINETANRGLLMPITVASANMQLPTPNPGKAIVWNAEGTGFQNSKDNFDEIITNNTLLANSVAANAAKAINSEKNAGKYSEAAEKSKKEAEEITLEFENTVQKATEEFNNNADEQKNRINDAVNLAKDWATKKNGTVDGFEYSAKQYALNAAQSAASIDPSSIKKIAFENYRSVECSGDITVYLQNTDEIIGLKVNDNATITIDTSQLIFPKYIYTVQFYVWFPNGVKTVSLKTNLNKIIYLNDLTPDFSVPNGHWLVVRTASEWKEIIVSDAGVNM